MYNFCIYALAKERRCLALRKTGADLTSFLQDVLKIRNKDTYRMISDHAKILQFNNKETIYRPYDLDSQFCFLIKGKARAYVIDENGHDLTFRFAYTPGDILLNEKAKIEHTILSLQDTLDYLNNKIERYKRNIGGQNNE